MTRPGRPTIAALALLCLGTATAGGIEAAPEGARPKVLVLGLDGLYVVH